MRAPSDPVLPVHVDDPAPDPAHRTGDGPRDRAGPDQADGADPRDPLELLRHDRWSWTEQLAGRFGALWGPAGRPVGRLAVAVVLLAAVAVVAVVVGAPRLVGGPTRADDDLPMTSRVTGSAFSRAGEAAAGVRPGSASAGSVAGGPTGAPPGTPVAVLWVDVGGAVARPGLYAVRSQARLAEAISAAGGLAPDADPDRINLAAVVVDGERIYVPRRGDVSVPSVLAGGRSGPDRTAGAGVGGGGSGGAGGPSTSAGPSPATPVDVNRAGAEELDRLPGVGPATAAAIIAHRTEHGPFRSVDDLAQVRGIGRAKLEQLRPVVTVG